MPQQAIGRSALVLSTNYGKLVSGLDKSYARMRSWKSQVTGLASGGFASRFGGRLGGDLLATATRLSDIGRAAKGMGAGTAEFMALGHAAASTGVEAEKFYKALGKMQVQVGGFLSGGGEAGKYLSQLGLSVADFTDKRPDEMFVTLADRMSLMTDASQQAFIATKLFGEAGGDLTILLGKSGAELQSFIAKQRAGGQALGEADLARLDKLKASLKGAGGYFEGVWNKIVVALAPILTTIGERVQAVFRRATPWIDVLVGGFQQFAELAGAAFEAVVSLIEDALHATRDWLGETHNTSDAATMVSGVVEGIATRCLDVASAVDTVYQSFKSVWYLLQSQILKALDAVKNSLADFITGLGKIGDYLGLGLGEDAKYWADGVRSAEFMAEAAERESMARQAAAKSLQAFHQIGGAANRDRVRDLMGRARPSDEAFKSTVKAELPGNFTNVLGAALVAGSKEEYSARVRLETMSGTNTVPLKQLGEAQKQTALLQKLADKPDAVLGVLEVLVV